MWSLSPVSIASLSSAIPSTTTASLGTCSPADKSMTSSRTISLGSIETSCPSRTTRIWSWFMRLSLSIMRRARNSVIIPVKALSTIIPKKNRLDQAWTAIKATKIAKLSILKELKTLRLKISQLLEPVFALKWFVLPASIRRLTSTCVKPCNCFFITFIVA